jgi:hypothetical protein
MSQLKIASEIACANFRHQAVTNSTFMVLSNSCIFALRCQKDSTVLDRRKRMLKVIDDDSGAALNTLRHHQ